MRGVEYLLSVVMSLLPTLVSGDDVTGAEDKLLDSN
jgi:hypothetical protein